MVQWMVVSGNSAAVRRGSEELNFYELSFIKWPIFVLCAGPTLANSRSGNCIIETFISANFYGLKLRESFHGWWVVGYSTERASVLQHTSYSALMPSTLVPTTTMFLLLLFS